MSVCILSWLANVALQNLIAMPTLMPVAPTLMLVAPTRMLVAHLCLALMLVAHLCLWHPGTVLDQHASHDC